MEYKVFNFNSFNLYTVKTTNFKNCHLEIVFRSKALEEKIIPRKLLMEFLTYSTSEFNTQRKLSEYLEELYNTSFYSSLSRVGSSLLTNFCFDFLNPKYTDTNFLDQVLTLITATITKPNLDNTPESLNNFKIIKSKMLNDITTSLENKKAYAYRKLFKYMDKNAYLSYDMLGTKEQINELNFEDLQSEYQRLIKEDFCDIYLIGNLDMEYIAKFFSKNFNIRVIKDYTLSLYAPGNSRSKVQIKKEKDKLEQSHLLVGCNLNNITEEEKDIIAYMYNYILGGNSLDTKLAKYLRQDNSLCYTVNSIYQKYDGVIVIYAGINTKSYNKAVSLIKKSLKEMTSKITTTELENAKKGITTSLNMINDNQNSIINNYLFENIASLDKVENRLKKLKSVKVEDIMKLAKKVKINTIYFLNGVEK